MVRSAALAGLSPDPRPGRHASGAVGGVLDAKKAADVGGLKRRARGIGTSDRNRTFTRHGAEFRPLARILYHTARGFVKSG